MTQNTQTVKKREDVAESKTWKLEDIFSTDDLWEEEFKALEADIPKIKKFQGKLNEGADTLFNLLKNQDELSERIGKLYSYAHMRNDQDTTNSFYQAMNMRAENILTIASSSMSFIVPEILDIEEARINAYLDEKKELKMYEKTLDEITRQRAHVLSKKEEELLAEAADPLQTSSQTFSMLNNADLKFPTLKDEEGKSVELTQGRYLRFLQSNKRDVRKKAFEAMFHTYGKYKNTFASTLNGKVKTNNFYAKVKNYDSARQAALDKNKIPETVYDHLVETINEGLPLLHRYMKLRKKVLQLDELHMYDVYTPLVPDVEMNFTYEEAKDYVVKALEPLGKEYTSIIQQGYDSRWIDVEENEGKRSGAYSSGSYGTHPYILLNWQDGVNDLFTLAHELGHSMHSYYTVNTQPFRYGSYSIFVAEVASTCNEALLNEYMLEQVKDNKEKLYLLNHFLEGFRTTVFRQTMFAEFEHEIHIQMQNGEALTAEKLTSIYYDLNKKYFGEEVVSDEEIGLEWARIPHFYMNYYVYQYATGYAAATTLAEQIKAGDKEAVDRYITFLKAGNSDYPIEVLKKAGVDMTSKQPIKDALHVFEQKLDEMEHLLS